MFRFVENAFLPLSCVVEMGRVGNLQSLKSRKSYTEGRQELHVFVALLAAAVFSISWRTEAAAFSVVSIAAEAAPGGQVLGVAAGFLCSFTAKAAGKSRRQNVGS